MVENEKSEPNSVDRKCVFDQERLVENEKAIVSNIVALELLLSKGSLHATKSLPSGVCTNQVIIVDLNIVKKDWQDDHAWKKTRASTKKPVHHAVSDKVYEVARHRYTHATSPDFHRLVVTAELEGQHVPFALVQYRFDGDEHSIKNKPHGNAKNSDPFIPTKKSTLEKLSEAVKTQTTKRALHNVEKDVGGLLAESMSSLPRNERQARYIKAKGKPNVADPISALLDMQLQEEACYIQSVTVDKNSPVILLFTKEQISDIKKFCCNEDGSNAPLCVDITFNLGNFYVLVTINIQAFTASN
ncbi:hypothetical protein QZH41_017921 [Actinostola sp. cb2023]|nr:hypothetical protein QZH41_017921 [Actinostola sp. cb2023]